MFVPRRFIIRGDEVYKIMGCKRRRMRGSNCWFAVDSKSFEVLMEKVHEKLRGIVVERI